MIRMIEGVIGDSHLTGGSLILHEYIILLMMLLILLFSLTKGLTYSFNVRSEKVSPTSWMIVRTASFLIVIDDPLRNLVLLVCTMEAQAVLCVSIEDDKERSRSDMLGVVQK